MYPNFAEISMDSQVQELDGGSHKVFLVRLNGRKVVYKLINSISDQPTRSAIKKILRNIDRPIFEYFMDEIPQQKYRDRSFTKYSDIELRTLKEWRKRGIPCTNVLEKHDDEIIYDYLDADKYSNILERIKFKEKEFNELIKTYDMIRFEAKKDQDKTLLHSDAHLRNFLYSESLNKAMAIDPGLKVKDNMNFEQTDAYINLFFSYCLTELNSPNVNKYLSIFSDSLSRKEKDSVLKINKPLSVFANIYFDVRTKTISFIKGEQIISPAQLCSYEKIDLVNNIFS